MFSVTPSPVPLDGRDRQPAWDVSTDYDEDLRGELHQQTHKCLVDAYTGIKSHKSTGEMANVQNSASPEIPLLDKF
jgi:hypothetical protein